MKRWMTGAYWGDVSERMVRAAASTALGLIGTGAIGVLDVPWPAIGSAAGLAAVVSLLASIVAGAGGDPGTAGFVTSREHAPRL
jgi:hypothetical protein